MAGELGKASLDLEANLRTFEKNVEEGKHSAHGLEHALDAVAAIANVAEKALNDVKMSQSAGVESRISAEQILSGVRGIGDESRMAALELDRVKLTENQAAETEAVGAVIDHELDNIEDKANRTSRALDGVKLRLAAAAGGAGRGVFGGRPGVGPFGAGYGRLGVLGTAVGVGALTAPAAGPALVGLLGSLPGLAAMAAGALGVLALAGHGVAKAIGGDKKAFDGLDPSAKKFVLTVRSLDGWMDKLQHTAAKGLFPGLEKGLKSALSPGTVGVITMAVSLLAAALGHAGAEWGHYFGSAEFQHIFGPLMVSAARNIGVMSDAAMHLFDALGVLARGAIPFTNWLTTAIDKGAKFADSWLHAKDASGELAHGMDEARVSLTLVAKLAGSLLNVVFALGNALYPVAKVAVKDLTDGLNALAGIISRNKTAIREIAGAFIDGLKYTVEAAAGAVRLLDKALAFFVGPQKAALIIAIGLIGTAIALALGPEAAAIVGAIIAVGLIVKHWGAIKGFFVKLGHEIVNALEYAWYLLEKGALIAALKIVEPFSHLPAFLGGWARKAKNSMQNQLDRLHPPNMAWGGYAQKAGAYTGQAWRDGFLGAIAGLVQDAFKGVGAAVRAYAKSRRKDTAAPPKPGSHAWYMQNLGYDPTRGGSGDVFGTPPPFTKNTGGSGSRSPIPERALNLEALARRQDEEAAALDYAGKKAREHLKKEIADLQAADRILEEKLKHAHGHRRTEIYNAITANHKKIDAARKRLGQAVTKGRQLQLDFALDQAKVAVDHAKEGSKAWDRAIAAEEKALRDEIRYWDKRAHNLKLSLAQRDAALKKELSYERQLKQLEKNAAQAAQANEAQFLQSFIDIQNTFAPNSMPYQPPGSGKTDTHLHDIKQEARESNRHLKALRDSMWFPGSAAGQQAAVAVGA